MARKLRQKAQGNPGGFKGAVNEVLRRGLAAGAKPARAPKPFVIKAKSCGFLPGVDRLKLNQLADAMEAEAFGERHRAQERPS